MAEDIHRRDLEKRRYESEDRLATSRLMVEQSTSLASKAAADALMAQTSLIMQMMETLRRNN
jgi:hypothetical protein